MEEGCVGEHRNPEEQVSVSSSSRLLLYESPARSEVSVMTLAVVPWEDASELSVTNT